MARDDDVVMLARDFCKHDSSHFKGTLLAMAANAEQAGHTRSASAFKYWAQQVGGGVPLEMPYQLQGLLTKDDVEPDLCVLGDDDRLAYGRRVPTGAEDSALQALASSYVHADELYDHHVTPANRALFYGPSGTGKSSSAELLAAALKLPVYRIRTSGLINSYLGKSLTNIDVLFDGIRDFVGVWVFDEFDSLAQNRHAGNDVAEMRRVTALFLERLEDLRARSIVICTTNAPDIMDPALVRRFDVAVEFALPDVPALASVWERQAEWVSLGLPVPDEGTLGRMASAGVSQADLVSAMHAAVRDIVCRGVEPTEAAVVEAALGRAKDARRLRKVGYL